MVLLLTGENEFAILQEQKRLTAEYLKDNDAFGLERLDAEDLDSSRLRDALLQLPFLVSKKLVVISSAFTYKRITEQLSELIGAIPDGVDLILVDPKADKRTKLFKELFKANSVQNYLALKGSQLEQWVVKYALECGSKISQGSARHLVDRVGPDQMLLAREIEKLSHTSEIIDADIDQLTDQSLKGSVFDLLDMTFSGKKEPALKLCDELLSNRTDPNEIISLIGWQLQVLSLVKYAGQGTPADIAKATGVHPFVVGKSLNLSKSISIAKIKQGIASTLDLDIKLKSTNIDPSGAVKVLVLELST